jgi:hypothetical protein
MMRRIAYIAQLGGQWVGKGDRVIATRKCCRIVSMRKRMKEGGGQGGQISRCVQGILRAIVKALRFAWDAYLTA